MNRQSGKVRVKFFLWPSIVISVIGSILLTIILNILL